MDLRQLKLVNNDEIICEAVEFHEEEDALVIRKALKLIMVSSENGMRYYAFRPFMMYQLDEKSFQIVNCAHIISEASPSEDLVSEYFSSLENLSGDDDDPDQESIARRALQKAQEYMYGTSNEADSGDLNIITFPGGNDKIH